MAPTKRGNKQPVAAGKILSTSDFQGFDEYSYNGKDTSPLSKYVTKPFWEWFVEWCIPMSLAANMMTFLGFLMLVFNLGLMSYFDWDFDTGSKLENQHSWRLIPSWSLYLCGFLQFLAHTLDGSDGMQARRTKTSSPLGELFDHGLDSMAALLQTVAVASAAGLVGDDFTLFQLFCTVWFVLLCFYMTHFEKYNTGILDLPWSYDLSQLGVAALFLASGYYGMESFHKEFDLPFFGKHTVIPYLYVMTPIGAAIASGRSIITSIQARTGNAPSATRNKLSLYEAMEPLFPITAQVVSSFVWVLYSPTGIYEAHPRVFLLTIGVVFSNLTCRLIVCQMTAAKFHAVHGMTIVQVLLVAASLLGLINEVACLHTFFVVGWTVHIIWGYYVVQDIAGHLGIDVFRIKPQ